MISRRTLTRTLIGVARPVMWPLVLSTLSRIIDQILGIVLLCTAAWTLASVGLNLSQPGPTDSAAVSSLASRSFAIMIAIAVIKAFLRYLEQFLGHYCAFRALELLRTDFFNKVWPQAPAIQHTTTSGDLLARATKDTDRIEVFFAHTWAPAVAAVIVPLGALGWLGAHISWIIAATITPFILSAALIVPFAFSGPAHRAARRTLRLRGDLTQHVTDTAQGLREVLGFDYTDRRLDEMDALSARTAQSTLPNRITSAVRRSLCEGLRLAALLSTIVVGADLVTSGHLTIPQMAIAAALCLGVFTPARGTEDFADDLERSFAAAERMLVLKERTPFVPDTGGPAPTGPITTIDFHQVSFRYPKATDTVRDLDDAEHGITAPDHQPLALNNVSLTIPGGRHTAIVGVSGSGKSTLAHLLLRHFDPDTGTITINGVPTTTIAPDNLRGTITEVSQYSHLFNTTIADNLRLADQDATDEELWKALTIAGMADDVTASPQGLATRVGEFGTELSGGQVQRLTLARALLTDANVFVLDEYTSHLNPQLAEDIRQQLRAARPHATLIEITHHPVSALHADHIIVLNDGQLAEQGRPAELATTPTSMFSHLLERWTQLDPSPGVR